MILEKRKFAYFAKANFFKSFEDYQSLGLLILSGWRVGRSPSISSIARITAGEDILSVAEQLHRCGSL